MTRHADGLGPRPRHDPAERSRPPRRGSDRAPMAPHRGRPAKRPKPTATSTAGRIPGFLGRVARDLSSVSGRLCLLAAMVGLSRPRRIPRQAERAGLQRADLALAPVEFGGRIAQLGPKLARVRPRSSQLRPTSWADIEKAKCASSDATPCMFRQRSMSQGGHRGGTDRRPCEGEARGASPLVMQGSSPTVA